MMEIKATHDGEGYAIALSGATAGSVIQLRFQDTMNGANSVQYLDADAQGNAKIVAPMNFGQHFAVSAFVNGEVVPFTYAPDTTKAELHLVHPEQVVAATPAHIAHT